MIYPQAASLLEKFSKEIFFKEEKAANDYDYEDSVLYKSAYHAGASFIVTRDKKGFHKSDIPVLTPEELLDLLKGI